MSTKFPMFLFPEVNERKNRKMMIMMSGSNGCLPECCGGVVGGCQGVVDSVVWFSEMCYSLNSWTI